MDINLSKTFDYLRFPLALLVVYLHITYIPTSESYKYIDWSIYDGCYLYNLCVLFVCQIARCAVPCFFLIAGYLLVVNISSLTLDTYVSKLSRRIKTLFIPYILWNLIAALYLRFLVGMHIDNLIEIFIAPANFPLWFLRNLIVLDIFFPLFYVSVRYMKWIGLVGLTIIYILQPIHSFLGEYTCLSIYFFYLGIYGGIYKVSLKMIKNMYVVYGGIIFLIITIYQVLTYGNMNLILQQLYLIVGVSTFIIMAYVAIRKSRVNVNTFWASSSFFIYAFHRLGPTYVSKQILFFLPDNNCYTDIIKFIFCPIITVLLCVVIYKFCSLNIPRILHIFTGGK